MAAIEVRTATLDDTRAISTLFRQRIGAWQRLNAQGQVEDVAYDALSIHERWQHGGPWMSLETGAIWLSHLRRSGTVTLVALRNGDVVGYVEAHPGSEPEPFGEHLHIAELAFTGDGGDLRTALLAALRDAARSRQLTRVTRSLSSYDRAALARWAEDGFTTTAEVSRFSVRTGTGQGFYQAVEEADTGTTQSPVDGWRMSLSREQSARQHWVTLWPQLWVAVPELAARAAFRLRFTASGFTTFVYAQEQLYDPRTLDCYAWSPRPLTAQWMTALRDWAHRQGYRALTFTTDDATLGSLSVESESLPYRQSVLALDL